MVPPSGESFATRGESQNRPLRRARSGLRAKRTKSVLMSAHSSRKTQAGATRFANCRKNCLFVEWPRGRRFIFLTEFRTNGGYSLHQRGAKGSHGIFLHDVCPGPFGLLRGIAIIFEDQPHLA